MKRLHIHLKTNDLNRSIAFYSAMFGEGPARVEKDYAKWLLDDPRAHISVSTHGGTPGFDHAGVSIETKDALDETAGRLRAEGAALFAEEETTCCYAQSNKYWVEDPQGARWELFQTFADSETYGAEPDRTLAPAAAQSANETATPAACCEPAR